MAAPVQNTFLYQPSILAIAQDKLKLDKYLTLFSDAVAKKSPSLTLSRYMDTVERTYHAHFELLQESQILYGGNFILKYKENHEAHNEKFCARVLQRLGVMTPIVRLIKHNRRNGESILSSFESYRRSTGRHIEKCDITKCHLLFMPAFEAKTLKNMIREHELETLPAVHLKFLFTALGEIAVYDLLIGNNDRLFRLDGSEDGSWSRPFFNPGNIMVCFTKNGEKRLIAIDNGSTRQLSNNNQPSSMYKKFKNAFLFLNRGHVDDFAKQLLRGIELCFKDFPREFSKQEAESALVEGVEEGCAHLKQLDPQTFLTELTPHAKTPLASMTLQLIQENLSILR